MSSTKTATTKSRRVRRRQLWGILAAAGLALAALGVLAYTLAAPVRPLPYGKFRKQRERDEIASARVGPDVIQGLLKEADREGRPIRFRVSRVGMEHDEDLIRLLAAHIPGGEFEADAGPSPLQTIVVPGALFVLMLLAFSWVIARSGGMGSAMAFVKSRPHVYGAGEVPLPGRAHSQGSALDWRTRYRQDAPGASGRGRGARALLLAFRLRFRRVVRGRRR